MKKQLNSTSEQNVNLDNLFEIFTDLDNIVPTIDKLGSGFEETERLSLALLLLFKEKKVLQTLSKIRKYIYLELETNLSEKVLEQMIDEIDDITFWNIPYDLTNEELLNRIKKDS